MANAVNVKWPGQHIADDSTHRLVTDAQIERWNRINNISGDEQYIELTPENISQYTCTKPDEYWTDMGLADGTIFDSSSLDEGNYIIKLGMDKLQKMPSVSSPNFRFGKDGYTYTELSKKMEEIWENDASYDEKVEARDKLQDDFYNQFGYQTYINYTIETQTFLFLCMFFDVELSIDDLIYKFDNSYGCEFVLQTQLQKMSGYEYYRAPQTEIKWPEAIRIKITKEPYGPENNMYVLKRNIFFDMNIVDYFNCYNYKWIAGYDAQSLTDEDYGIATLDNDENGVDTGFWEPCEFTGVPVRNISKGNSTVPYYSTTLTSKTSREYIVQSSALRGRVERSLEYSPYDKYMLNIYEMVDSIYVRPNTYQGAYIKCQTIINSDGMSIFNDEDLGLNTYNNEYWDTNGTSLSEIMNHKNYGIHMGSDHLYLLNEDFTFKVDYYNNLLFETDFSRFNVSNYCLNLEIESSYSSEYSSFYICGSYLEFTCESESESESKTFYMSMNGLRAELSHPLKIKLNDTTTYTYNNTEDITIDLSELSAKTSVITNWNSATTNGEYSSKIGATNAPTSTIAYMGSVVRGNTSITQKLYADTDDLTAVSEYIRRGKITVDSNNKETITWGNWYCVDYAIPSAE